MNELSDEYQQKYQELKEILFSLYLNGVPIINTTPVLKSPWWCESCYEYLTRFKDVRNRELYIKLPVQVAEEMYDKSLKTHSILLKQSFFTAPCYPISNNFLKIAFDKKADIEWIFKAHIILEYLFAPGNKGELSFSYSIKCSIIYFKRL